MKAEPCWFRFRGLISALVVVPFAAAVALSPAHFPESSWGDLLGDLLGWLLLASGLLLRLWATLYIGGRKSAKLVTNGPYALCRHPLYVASWLIALSLPAFLESISLLAAMGGLAIIYAILVVPSEERHARQCFDSGYLRYAAETPRFLPRSLRLGTPGWVEVKVGPFLRECMRALVLVALAAGLNMLEHCHGQPWWPLCFGLP